MYMDKENTFSENQTIANGVSTNSIYQKGGGDAYEQPFLVVSLDTPLATGQGLIVEVQTAVDEAFSTPITLATFTGKIGVGRTVVERLPRGLKEYTRLKYTVTGTPSGKLTATLALDVHTR